MSGIFKDKVALVTGAGSGIGRASACLFAREGAKVIVHDIVAEGGQETVRLIKNAGGEASFIKGDVSKAADVEALVKQTIEIYGRLDCAHNNAGIIGAPMTFLNCTEEEWDRVMGVDIKGVWLCMKYEIPQMLKQGGGAIVNTSSTMGLAGGMIGQDSHAPMYTVAKHGVVGITKQAALELAKKNIRVNAICPGYTNTGMSRPSNESEARALAEQVNQIEPIGRLAEPEEIAAAAIWLCSDAASYVTGIAMPVDGGWMAY